MKRFERGLGATNMKELENKAFREYQAEMLAGIGFVHSKADIDWMENYERLVGE